MNPTTGVTSGNLMLVVAGVGGGTSIVVEGVEEGTQHAAPGSASAKDEGAGESRPESLWRAFSHLVLELCHCSVKSSVWKDAAAAPAQAPTAPTAGLRWGTGALAARLTGGEGGGALKTAKVWFTGYSYVHVETMGNNLGVGAVSFHWFGGSGLRWKCLLPSSSSSIWWE
ncbi:unnamed protein product [Pleuronectes platessa]|uniref:Uncharacterized protein n=1 Tax=Pleuronectes platessa TaxID=8262 RepID=A0A9N7VUK9_PLEPL|nr:unnamed protein product [Pleuronectes platessa]